MIGAKAAVPNWVIVGLSVVLVVLLGTIWWPHDGESIEPRVDRGAHRTDARAEASVLQALTERERLWLEEHPVIRVVQDPSWPPLEFVDRRQVPSGVATDYMHLVEERLGLQFVRVEASSWQDAYPRLQRWEIDMTTSVTTTQAREAFWSFTKPYITFPVVIVAHTDVPYIRDMRELNHKKVAVVDGYAAAEWMLRDFPDIEQRKVVTVKEGLELLQRGEVFAYVENMLVVGYSIAQYGTTNLKVAGSTPYTNQLSMAVRKDWAPLAGILQKALDSISDAERAEIYRRWVPVRFEHGFDYRVLWRAVALFATIVGGLIYWNHKLSKEIQQRIKAESDLLKNKKFLDDVIENLPTTIFLADAKDLRFMMINRAGEELLGYSRQELLGKTASDVFPKATAEAFSREDRTALDRPGPVSIPQQLVATKHHGERILRTKKIAILNAEDRPEYLLGISEDVTEHQRLAAQVQQAQKMESIGRLAGGVAHDFNNLLTVILGNTELTLDHVPEATPVREGLLEIQKAATQSAELTRQLLAFARKQTVVPQMLAVNGAVEGTLKMIRRLIGANIVLTWAPAQDLWPVRMDPAQIDQILVNLCVNARDAIRGEGNIVIRTQNVASEQALRLQIPDVMSGDFVRLSVTDDGCGMEASVMESIFEPFFTTKEVGRGTGLGLSTVYGIVKQNRGHVVVNSRPGGGTTFDVYLPRHVGHEVAPPEGTGPNSVGRGHETVLMIEDESAILSMGKTMLETLGYRVLTAATPEEAQQVASASGGDVDLLITDVIMPGMNGVALATLMMANHPQLKCLFMSGHASDVIDPSTMWPEKTHFIQKPFSRNELAAKVREALQLQS